MDKRKREGEQSGEGKRQKTDNNEVVRLIEKANVEQVRGVLAKIVAETETQSRAIELLKESVCTYTTQHNITQHHWYLLIA